MYRLLPICLLTLFLVCTPPAYAQRQAGVDSPLSGARSQDLTAPLLYPGNGSYFLLVRDFTGSNNGVNWEEARLHAAKRQYKGRQGRLAVIDSPDLQQWILTTFNLQQYSFGGRTWIGLRYWCRYRQLTLANSEAYPASAFTAWDQPWARQDGINCTVNAKLPYMGVYIEGMTGRWRAVGYKKRWPYYLVEFPVPAETAREAAAPASASGRDATAGH